MRRAWNFLKAHFFAFFSSLAAFFQRREPVREEFTTQASKDPKELKGLFYCYQGAHQGELFEMKEACETLGSAVDNSQVISSGNSKERFQVLTDNGVQLIAPPGSVFNLNGEERVQSYLYDFDPIDLLKNRFLFLDTSLSQNEPLMLGGEA